jgi:hypothetical protein
MSMGMGDTCEHMEGAWGAFMRLLDIMERRLDGHDHGRRAGAHQASRKGELVDI